MLKINENNRIEGIELHKTINSKNKNYSLWIKRVIHRADLIKEKDFFTIMLKSTGGRPKTQYVFTIQAAKEICITENNQTGKELRRWLINLDKRRDEGKLFPNDQIIALIDLSKSMTLISIQKEVERKHYNLYNGKYTWYKYRAELLGYSTKDIIEAMRKVNKKHNSIRKSLIKLDSNELIRVGIIDFFKALNKSDEYAINAGNLCKEMAKRMDLGHIIWDDTKPNPLGLNESSINERKDLFDTNQKKIR